MRGCRRGAADSHHCGAQAARIDDVADDGSGIAKPRPHRRGRRARLHQVATDGRRKDSARVRCRELRDLVFPGRLLLHRFDGSVGLGSRFLLLGLAHLAHDLQRVRHLGFRQRAVLVRVHHRQILHDRLEARVVAKLRRRQLAVDVVVERAECDVLLQLLEPLIVALGGRLALEAKAREREQHLFGSLLAERHVLVRIRVRQVRRRVVVHVVGDQQRALRHFEQVLEVILALPREVVARLIQQHLLGAVGIADAQLGRVAARMAVRLHAEHFRVVRELDVRRLLVTRFAWVTNLRSDRRKL